MVTSILTNRLNRTPKQSPSAGTRGTRGEARGRGGRRPKDLVIATVFFIAYSVVCFATVIWHCGRENAGTSFIWALASATLGGAFGFLFGIPKILQGSRLPEESASSAVIDYRQQVNTNLTEISDWLTKIIVGLSLINLAKFPPYLTAMARTLASSIEGSTPEKHMAFAYALIVCFSILGFLFGYLYTRLYLQGAFSRADQEAASSTQDETEARVKTLETVVESHRGLIMHDRAQLPVAAKGNGGAGEDPAPDTRRGDPLAALHELAASYLNIDVSVPDPGERMRRKDEAAIAMFNFVVNNNISKDVLLREAQQGGNEALILTLAHCILNGPERGDLQKLLRVTGGVESRHVKERIVQALGQLFGKHCAADRAAALKVLSQYEVNADESLLSLIQGTRSLIERNTQREGAKAV